MPTIVRGPGDVELNQALAISFVRKYVASIEKNLAWVDPVLGSDKTGEVGNQRLPFATVGYPLRYTRAQIILLADGVYPPFDFRHTDPYGSLVKIVACQHLDRCVVQVPGTVLSTAAWQPTRYSGVYTTAIPSDGKYSGHINRVLLQDGTVDQDGFPQRLPEFCYSAANQSQYAIRTECDPSKSVAQLSKAGWGWFYDPKLHLLYIALNGADMTRPANASRLRATYFDPTGYTRNAVYGTTILYSGIYFDGVGIWDLEYLDSNTNTRIPSEVWNINSIMFAAGDGYGIWVVGSHYYEQGVHIHAPTYDCINGSNGDVDRSGSYNLDVIASYDSIHEDAGDPETFGYDSRINVPNANGESAHGGVNVQVATLNRRNHGPEVADGVVSAGLNLTWLAASIARDDIDGNTSPGGFVFYGHGTAGSADNREAWIDTSYSVGENGNALQVDNGAIVHIYNSSFDSIRVTNGSQAPIPYTPDNP